MMGDYGQILDHVEDHMTVLGYIAHTETFDLQDLADAQIDKAFCLVPGSSQRSDLSMRHVDEELEIRLTFRQPPVGKAAAKVISAANMAIVWHFLEQKNQGPADRIQWAGSTVVKWEAQVLELRIGLVVSYPGLMKPANA
jgi:hypothetical protein